MESPVYVNGFAVSYNSVREEVTINGTFEYPKVSFNEDGKIVTTEEREFVSKITMSKNNANKLTMLIQALLHGEENEKSEEGSEVNG